MDFSSLETWGYLAIAFFSFGGSMLIVATAGVFAYLGHINLPLALTIATISNFLGDNFLFYIAKYHKSDIQKYLAKHRRKIAITKLIMKKYGVAAIFIQKFIYGVKTLIPIIMALGKYDFKKFIFYNFFASIVFVLTIGLLSYFSSEIIIKIFNFIKDKPYIAPLILAVLVFIIWNYLKKIERR